VNHQAWPRKQFIVSLTQGFIFFKNGVCFDHVYYSTNSADNPKPWP
jgi:hypothetical protein